MKDSLLRARVVFRTSNINISRRRLADYVKKLHQKVCHTCSTIIFPHSTNQIDFWCCYRCRRNFFNSAIKNGSGPLMNHMIGWINKNNRAARAARFLVQFFDGVCQTTTWNFQTRDSDDPYQKKSNSGLTWKAFVAINWKDTSILKTLQFLLQRPSWLRYNSLLKFLSDGGQPEKKDFKMA